MIACTPHSVLAVVLVGALVGIAVCMILIALDWL